MFTACGAEFLRWKAPPGMDARSEARRRPPCRVYPDSEPVTDTAPLRVVSAQNLDKESGAAGCRRPDTGRRRARPVPGGDLVAQLHPTPPGRLGNKPGAAADGPLSSVVRDVGLAPAGAAISWYLRSKAMEAMAGITTLTGYAAGNRTAGVRSSAYPGIPLTETSTERHGDITRCTWHGGSAVRRDWRIRAQPCGSAASSDSTMRG